MKRLRAPLKIKGMRISNRLVMPPMATYSAVDGRVAARTLEHYDKKTRGGYIGLVITEHCYVSPEGMARAGQLSISRDSDVDSLGQLAELLHQNGSKAIAQLNHAGSSARPEVTGLEPISASAVANIGSSGGSGLVPRQMEQGDIHRVVEAFAAAARRAKEAGFDGVEIHSAHAYLLNQFYSPLANVRTDSYGGDLMGRIRLHLEIIAAVRQAVGEDYLVALRLGACDYMEGGSTLEDGVAACKAFERAGVDLLDISGGFCGYNRPGHKEAGYFAELSQAVKREVAVPVILTGGITEPREAEALLAEEKADLIGVGRALLRDSYWARKAQDSL